MNLIYEETINISSIQVSDISSTIRRITRERERERMARELASVIADSHAAEHVWLQSSGGTVLLLCMIFMSFSVLSLAIFVCADGLRTGEKHRPGPDPVPRGGCGGGCGGSCGGGGG